MVNNFVLLPTYYQQLNDVCDSAQTLNIHVLVVRGCVLPALKSVHFSNGIIDSTGYGINTLFLHLEILLMLAMDFRIWYIECVYMEAFDT